MSMNPEWLPVLALLIGGIFAGIAAVRLWLTGQHPRALLLSGIAVALLGLVFTLGTLPSKRLGIVDEGTPLTPAAMALPSTVGADGEERDSTSTSLLLGGVTLRVAREDRYVLSVDGMRFLQLDLDPSGLWITGEVLDPENHPAARIRRNRVASGLARGVRVGGSDHVLLLSTNRMDYQSRPHTEPSILARVRYQTPRRIEVMGNFLPEGAKEPVTIGPGGGIRWSGGGFPSGGTIDLRPQGKGRIDFERSGLVQVLR